MSVVSEIKREVIVIRIEKKRRYHTDHVRTVQTVQQTQPTVAVLAQTVVQINRRLITPPQVPLLTGNEMKTTTGKRAGLEIKFRD